MVDSWILFPSVPQDLVQENTNLTNTSSGARDRKTSVQELKSDFSLSRSILNKTSDGIPTFLPLYLPSDAMPLCNSTCYYTVLKTLQELRALIYEREINFELVKDIYNDLGPHSLCHRILRNISILTNADRCLVSQLFDVHSTVEQMQRKEEIHIPWGNDIARHVAECRESLNIPDCYKDIRFNSQVDRTTGYKAHNMLFMPIHETGGEVKAVAQIINKYNGEDTFTHADEEVLLELARIVFEEPSTIGQIVHRIMIHIVSYLHVERCQILLLDQNTQKFSRVFDLDVIDMKAENFDSSSPFEGRFPINVGITGYVATTGEILNIPDVIQDDRFDPLVDEDSNFRHHSILCMPIRNTSKNIIGVCQLINKLSRNCFTKKDEHIFEICTIFCGLGIQHVQMHERTMQSIAKTKVTLEVLSYHATAPLEEVQELLRENHIPSTEIYRLYDLKFNDFSLKDKEMLKACIRMFMEFGFIQRFGIEYDVSKLCHVLGELETLSLLIACLCHDLDHRGVTNAYLKKSSSPLAQLYSTSTMEHHHFDQCIMILNIEGNELLSHLSSQEYINVVHVLEEAILATDLTVYYKRQFTFTQMTSRGNYNWKKEDNRELLRAMLMTASDIAAITKPWEVQKKD
ncbi:dual 3',5'-cyclic-AMP and -GMP phosphodiesterase 11 [Caerostris darwini]|uniref:Phosphodiesterase n=1 Tax=Caerostris darwini TaxID=1538125 RepID=A0AAV4VYY9_9ARAC|nr:dual 3',5'-cyclic-AMP and -GMP phosphodiesterase 11 [Caerostris darwini]